MPNDGAPSVGAAPQGGSATTGQSPQQNQNPQSSPGQNPRLSRTSVERAFQAPEGRPPTQPAQRTQREEPKTHPGDLDRGEGEATEPKEPAYPKTVKLKVYGEEKELPFEEVVRRAQMSEAAQKRMQQAAEAVKFQQRLRAAMQSGNPLKALVQLGMISPEQAKNHVEDFYYDNYLAQEELTPEQRRIRELEDKTKTYEEKLQQEAEAKRQEAVERKKGEFRKHFHGRIIDAIERSQQSDYPLPVSEETVAAIANYLLLDHQQGIDFDERIHDIQRQVWQDQVTHSQKVLSKASGEQIWKMLGEDVLNRAMKWKVEQLKAGQIRQPAPPKAMTPRGQQPRKKMTVGEWRKARNLKVTEEII